MRIILIISLATIGLFNTGKSLAGEDAQKLGVCLTNSMNGKERKNLAKWIYIGMSAHSVIKPYSNVTTSDTENSNKYVGELITRLITKDCPTQARLAFKEGGGEAFKYAFGIVGKVAMQELMADSSVSQALGGFEKYLKQDQFDQVFKE